MYAFVRFLEDNVCYALPVSCVQDFSPTSQLDFDNQKVYTVYRNPEEAAEEDDESPGEWGERLLLHKAQILALAGGRGQGRLREGAGGGRSPGGVGGAGPGGSASDPQGCAGASAGGTAGRGGERGRVGESPPRGKKKKREGFPARRIYSAWSHFCTSAARVATLVRVAGFCPLS